MTTAERPAESTQSAGTPRLRLHFIDGLRALAALYVLGDHIAVTVARDAHAGAMSRPVAAFANFLRHGDYAVMLFIVLSGYCLMLPVAGSADHQLKGGIWRFFYRRARRLLPPYYAALAFSLTMIALIPAMRHISGNWWDDALPAFTAKTILAHVALVHDLIPSAFIRIDPPMWSIAIEWHIYFIFPTLLLPVWRRYGAASATVAGIIIGYLVHRFSLGILDFAHPEYAGLFAAGMAASAIALGPLRTKGAGVPWAVGGLAALALGIGLQSVPALARYGWFGNTLYGLFVAGTLIWLTWLPHGAGTASFVKSFLEMKLLVAVGLFSYSLYLFHAPILTAFYFWLRPSGLDADLRFIILCAVAPLIVALTRAIHVVVERPFMNIRTQ